MKKRSSSRRREPQHSICSRCGWSGICDAIADVAFCPDCLADLGTGDGKVFQALLDGRGGCRCCPAAQRPLQKTVRFRSVPLSRAGAIEMPLCPAHLNDLITASLSIRAVRRLRNWLRVKHGLEGVSLFLLDLAWYDAAHNALQPAHGIQEPY